MRTPAEIIDELTAEMAEWVDTCEHYPLFLLAWQQRGRRPWVRPDDLAERAAAAVERYCAERPCRVVWAPWPYDPARAEPLEPGTRLDFETDPVIGARRVQVLVPESDPPDPSDPSDPSAR